MRGKREGRQGQRVEEGNNGWGGEGDEKQGWEGNEGQGQGQYGAGGGQ
jgi:hypothetical protein